jgi:hypothetical protein
MNAPTPAGMKLLCRFVEAERSGLVGPGGLKVAVSGLGEELGRGVSLRHGEGAELAAARKLVRGGFAKLFGGGSNTNRILVATAAGRAAVQEQTP